MKMDGSSKSSEFGKSPLANWRVLKTNDIDCAYDTIAGTFKEHTFELSERSRYSDTRLHHLDFGDVSINYIQYGTNIVVDADYLENFFLVHMPIKGTSNVWHEDDIFRLDGNSAVICSPTRRSKFQWHSDTGVVAVKIARSALYDYISDVHGLATAKDFVFAPEMTGESGAFLSWRNLIQYIITEAQNEQSLINKPGVGEELKRLLLSCLINNQPHNQSSTIAGRTSTAAPRHVRLAEEYARANLASRITVSDLARCSNVSERTLFDGFRQFRNTTPLNFVNDLRLEQIRRELRHGDDTTSIAEISSRWGITHQGAFAKAYKRKFGETASQTRKKTHSSAPSKN